MKRYFFMMFLFTFLLVSLVSFPEESSANKSRGVIRDGNATGSSYSPTDVDPSIKRAWERWNANDRKKFIKGGKYIDFPPSSGRYLAFDIYEDKSWKIRNDHLIFEGWSANIGRYHHDRYNQATYIGAIELNENGIKKTGKRKIFKAEMLVGDHAATKGRGKSSDIYFDNGTNTKWCPESTSSVNYDQSECNMEYKHVGFRAHLPLKELFPSTKENKQWKLYLIKNINGHLVYDELVMSFTTDSRTWNRGTVSLFSKVDNKVGHTLRPLGTSTLKRLEPGKRNAHPNYSRYFKQGNAYRISNIRMISNSITPWYQLIVPEDNNAKRWTTSPYLRASGQIATLQYERNYYDVGVKHIDGLTKEVLLEEKPKEYKLGTKTFKSKPRGHFKTPEQYEYVPLKESKRVKVDRDKTVVFEYKASLPNPSRIVEQSGGVNTHGKSAGEAEWKLAKDKSPETLPDPNSDDFQWRNVTGGVEITKYLGENKNVIIPEKLGGKTVVSIGKNSFANLGLTSIRLPETVVRIGEEAFKENNINVVSIPENTTEIGAKAFKDNKITEVTLSNSVKTIGSSAFENNEISDLVLGESIESIGKKAFYNNQIGEFNSTNSPNLKYIEDEAFFNNDISKAMFNEGLIRIGQSAFENNYLSKVIIPKSVDNVNSHAFSNNLINVAIIYNNQTVLGKSVFAHNQEDSEDLTIYGYIPSTAKNYADEYKHTFKDLYEDYVYVDVTGGVEIIKYNGNDYDLNIPTKLGGKDVVSIGSEAFKDMALTSVKIPKTVHTIKELAFADNKLTSIDLSNVKIIKSGAFTRNKLENVKLNNNLEELGGFAFRDNKLKSITIPPKIKTIEQYTFTNNELSNVYFSGGNHSIIKEHAFSDNNLKKIDLPDTIYEIGESAFWNNELTKLNLPEKIKKLGERAFDSNNLSEILIKNDDLEIGSRAFEGNQDEAKNFLIYASSKSTAREYAEGNGHLWINTDKPNPESDFEWVIDKETGHALITKYKGKSKDIVIPETLGGKITGGIITTTESRNHNKKPVFENRGIKSVVFPKHFKQLPNQTFRNNDIDTVLFLSNIFVFYSGFDSPDMHKNPENDPFYNNQSNPEDIKFISVVELKEEANEIPNFYSESIKLHIERVGYSLYKPNIKEEYLGYNRTSMNKTAFSEPTKEKYKFHKNNPNENMEDNLSNMNEKKDIETKNVDLNNSNVFAKLLNFFKLPKVSAETKLSESLTHLINNFVITGNHRDVRNVKHTIKVGNHLEKDTKPFAITINPKETKDKEMEYDFEYEYTNHIKHTYKCTDKKGKDCFVWKLDKSEPAWEEPYVKKFKLSDTTGEFERYTTSRVGRINNGNALIYSSLDDTTGTKAGNSRVGNTYYIKEKAVKGNEARYLISTSPSSTSGVIGWVNELDMTTYTHYEMDQTKKTFKLTGEGRGYTIPWGAKNQRKVNLRDYKGKTFKVNLTQTIGDNIWYRGTITGVSGNVWINKKHTTSNEIIQIKDTKEVKLNNATNKNSKLSLKMNHQHNEDIIVENDEQNKIELLVGRKMKHNERTINERKFVEEIVVDRKDTKLATQTWKNVQNNFKYKSDYKNEFTVVDGDKYYFPYDIDKSVQPKYKNSTSYNYGKYALPLRVSNESKNELEFKLADNFFLTKKTGFMFSLPHDEVSTLVINQTAKEEYESIVGEKYDDTVIGDPFDASKYYLNIDLNAKQKPNTKYDDNVVIGKLGLSDITVHLIQELEFEHYLLGHYSDKPVFVSQRTTPNKNIVYPYKVKLSKKDIDKLREIQSDNRELIHSFKPTNYKKYIEKIKEVVPY